MKNVEIKDNFLDDMHLIQLDEIVDNKYFAWYLQKEQNTGYNDGCWLSHLIYNEDEPSSVVYNSVIGIFNNYLKYICLCRIVVNLLLKQDNPSISVFHTDFNVKKMTTAIFYLNTNNGYTEFKDGSKIDCVRNRLVMFPATIPHRAIGQTDETKRIVFNFNFIK